MKIGRIARHLLATRGQVTRAFPSTALAAIEAAIRASEALHAGQVRFVVEAGLDAPALFRGQSAHERALELFAQLRVWDTEHNSGLLIYLLLADRAVEIVADRGIDAKAGADLWSGVCRQMEAEFGRGNFEAGVIGGIQAVTQPLARHFPAAGRAGNELPDAPLVL